MRWRAAPVPANAERQKSIHHLRLSLPSVRCLDLGARVTVVDPSPASSGNHVNFDAPAILRKWPSLNNQRRADAGGAYLLVDDTLEECIQQFLAKPPRVRHLYEIHTSPQEPFVGAIVSGENVAELAHLREFLMRAAMTLGPPAAS